jgi:hypothetical protein
VERGPRRRREVRHRLRRPRHLAFIPHGLGAAQRGWLTLDNIITTWPLDRLAQFLAETTRLG